MAEKNTELRVFGMTCDDCTVTVRNGLLSAEGVLRAEVDLKSGISRVTIEDTKTDPEKLITIPVFGKGSHYKAQVKKY